MKHQILRNCKKGAFSSFKILLEISAVIVCLLFILVGALAFRLSTGPLQIPYLTDTIREAVDGADLAYDIEFSDISLFWPAIDEPVLLSLEDVILKNKQGLRLASVYKISVNLSTKGLFQGYIHPSELLIQKPDIYLRRNKDGAFAVDLFTDKSAVPEGQIEKTPRFRNLTFGEMLDIASGHKNISDKSQVSKLWFKNLSKIRIDNGVLKISDIKTGQFWNIPKLDFNFSRMDEGFGGTLDFDIKLNNKNIPVSSKVFYQRTQKGADALNGSQLAQVTRGNVDWEVVINDLNVTDLMKRFKVFTIAEGSNVDLDLGLRLRVNRALELKKLKGEVETKDAKLVLKDILNKEIDIDNLQTTIEYDDDLGIAHISKFNATLFDDISTQAKLTWDLNKTIENLVLESSISNANVEQVLSLWPEVAQPNARIWVAENIKSGEIKDARFNMNASVDTTKDNPFVLNDLSGGFLFSNVVMEFLPGFPNLEKINGASRFNDDEFVFDVSNGTVDELSVGESSIRIYNFDHSEHKKELITISIGDAQGKVEVLSKFLALEPLNLLTPLNKNPEDFSGDFAADLTLKFPLDKDLMLEDVYYKADAKARNFSLNNVIDGYDLENADLALSIDPVEMIVNGQGNISSIALKDLNLKMDVSGQSPITTEVSAKTIFSKDDIGELLPEYKDLIDPHFDGEIATKVVFEEFRKKDNVLSIVADLKKAKLSVVEPIAFEKKIGQSLDLKTKIVFNENSTIVKDLSLSSTDQPIKLNGDISFDNEFEIKSAKFNRFLLGENDFSATLTPKKNKILEIDIDGKSLDARPFLSDDKTTKTEEKNKPKTDHLTYVISVNIGKILTVDDYSVRDVKAYLVTDGTADFDQAEVDLKMQDGSFRLRYKPAKQSGYKRLKLKSDNLGSFLSHFGITNTLKGGRVFAKAEATKENPHILKGPILIKDLKAIEAPVIARILNGMSLEGLGKILNNKEKGLLFKEITTNITIDQSGRIDAKPDVIKLRDGKTKSDSLGLTFEGNIQPKTDQINLQGTVVPVDDINTFFASIPLIGDIITMGSRDAIFAATYSVKGKASNPDVSVNPLATLAPGFLRNLFFESDIDESRFEDE